MLTPHAYTEARRYIERLRDLCGELHTVARACADVDYLNFRGSIELENFVVQEFVPPEIYDKWRVNSLRFVDIRMVWSIIALRFYWSRRLNRDVPVTCNTWLWGGRLRYAGYRPSDCATGMPESAHKRGMALDVDVSNVPASIVRKEIIQKPQEPAFRFITALEDDVSWCHMACEYTGLDHVLLIPRPKKDNP